MNGSYRPGGTGGFMSSESPVMAGYVWDLDTVRKVQGLTCHSIISEFALTSSIATTAQWHQHESERLKYQMIEAARVHAIEMHPDDVHIEATSAEYGIRYQAAWEPREPKIVVVGEGGWAVRALVSWEFIKRGSFFLEQVGPLRPGPTVHCALVGWHETERRWMFTPDATIIAPNEPL